MTTPLLEVRGLTRTFPPARPGAAALDAVRDVGFTLARGEALGIVGGSGSGKSTLARLVTRLLDPDAGQIRLAGQDITRARGAALRAVYARVQMVFQSPAASFDGRCTLLQAVAEPLRNAGVPRRAAEARALALLAACGLDADTARRLPGQVSGGQCQRAAIARALAVGPQLLVCDEATSALDVTVQRQIVALLEQLRTEGGLALLFISHDLALVQQVCSRVIVLQNGRIVEQGPVAEVLTRPQHPYTRALIEAAW